jgi:uncharacterized Zn ribbon protein
MKVRTTVENRRRSILRDWRELQTGDDVTIVKDAKVVATGQVEEVSNSGRVLWIKNTTSQTEVFMMSEGAFVQRK